MLVGCALAILLDYCWPIPAPARLALLLALIALIATVAYRRLLRPLARAMDDRTMAQLAERRIPALDGRLLTRVDGIDLGSRDGELLGHAVYVSIRRPRVGQHDVGIQRPGQRLVQRTGVQASRVPSRLQSCAP